MPARTSTSSKPASSGKTNSGGSKPASTTNAGEPQQQYTLGTQPADEIGEDLTLPSGATCRAVRADPATLVKTGVLNELDNLTGIVSAKQDGKTPAGPDDVNVDLQALMSNREQLTQVFDMIDRVVCHVVIKPTIKPPPNDPTNRQPDVGYTDMIDLDDKMFLFNYAFGGARDLESFRRQTAARMGDVAAGEGVQQPA